ncbi:MAG: twin-arginine translocation signal domain-containing protein [Candidatus Aminicenantes bacterium]|nr:twin-arginine translocation signal domain-containing protein [Candidatus Aminicenantes bacterium]
MDAKTKGISRRTFLKNTSMTAAGAALFPTIIPSSVLGFGTHTPPSDQIVMAGIGYGMMGIPNMASFLTKKEVKWVAVCDLDQNHLIQARDMVNEKYGNTDCTTTQDFREICSRKDIDAVCLSLPDHWHAIIAISCVRAGFDIYGEKPFTHSLIEGRALCDAVQRYGCIWQTGSWQRSVANFHKAAELVRNGRIGRVKKIEVGLPQGHHDFAGTKGQETIGPPPEHLDYDFWLGPAPYAPYCPARVHRNWRWNMDYGGGQLMDWVGHHVDIAHWGMDYDSTGPVEIQGTAEYQRAGVWNSPTQYRLELKYADGTPMTVAGGHSDIRGGTKWIGEHGWVWCNRGGFETSPSSLIKEFIGPDETKLYQSSDHYQNFLDCVKTRKQTITPAETAHRSASVGHLGVIAIEMGRKIRFDPQTETIVNDPEASRLLSRSYRKPWELPE